MNNIIPQYTLTPEGDVIAHESAINPTITIAGATANLGTDVSHVDPDNSLAVLNRRVAEIDAKLNSFTFDPMTGEKQDALSPTMRARLTGERAQLDGPTRAFETANRESVIARQAANAAAQAALLQNEADSRDAVEARAVEIAFEQAAQKRAVVIARDLKL